MTKIAGVDEARFLAGVVNWFVDDANATRWYAEAVREAEARGYLDRVNRYTAPETTREAYVLSHKGYERLASLVNAEALGAVIETEAWLTRLSNERRDGVVAEEDRDTTLDDYWNAEEDDGPLDFEFDSIADFEDDY